MASVVVPESAPCIEVQRMAENAKEAIYDAAQQVYYGPSGLITGYDVLVGRIDAAEGILAEYNMRLPELEFACRLGRVVLR